MFWSDDEDDKVIKSLIHYNLRLSPIIRFGKKAGRHRTIQTLEDMLRACVMDWGGSWEDHIRLVEFAYNNSYQASIRMAPFEALYGRPCRSPLCWVEAGESQQVRQVTDEETGEIVLLGPEILQETTDRISLIRENIRAAQSRQKRYADKRRIPLEFRVGDLVFLRVNSRRGLQKSGKLGKLAP